MIYTTGTIAISGNTVTGTGTNFSEPLSLIRVGCTLIAIGNPVQIFTITEIKSGTELSVTPAANPAIPAGTKFSILLSDSISVDGLAQDVAETLRYFQGQETEIAYAVEWWKDFGGDGQMEQLLADIRAETAQSTANAQKTEADKNTTEGYKNAAASSATAAKSSQDAAKASETSASNSKTAAATSETNAAQSAADALNYRNQAQAIVGTDIGLGASPRDCPDISGKPSGYIGFMRIREAATGFPSIASGEAYLTGFISVNDGSPSYTGIFQGWGTRSIYTYRWAEDLGPQWTRHARKDEVDRISQIGSDQTRIYAGNGTTYFELGNDRAWGVYESSSGQWRPLCIAQGGTEGRNAGQARTNLEVMYEKKSDLGSTDINTLTGEYSGFYYQGLDANATSARGYPVSSAGALLVIRNNANGNAGCTQLYFPYNATTGTFYMRQHIIQSSTTGWEWTSWKKFQSLDYTDSPQFTNLNLVRSSDVTTTTGGILQSILNDTTGAQRTRCRFYSEFRGDSKAWATIHLQNGDVNQYAGLSEDGDFSLNSGDFIGRRLKLTANFNYPVEITSAHPTIKFTETDRPSNTPYYSFIFDGGNWRIQKDGYDGTNSSNAISYNYARNEIDVPNLKVTAIEAPRNLEQTKTNMQIPFTGLAKWVDYNAPTGAEAGKYYPVIISQPSHYDGDFFVEVAMRTISIAGDQEPNCNDIHLWIRDGGWTDMGQGCFGHYACYASNEVAILCVRGTDKGQYPHNAIYVRGDAFPIRLAVTVGCTVTIPTADWSPSTAGDSPIYKWGITDSSDGLNIDTYAIAGNLLDFSGGRSGFYCDKQFRHANGDGYLCNNMTVDSLNITSTQSFNFRGTSNFYGTVNSGYGYYSVGTDATKCSYYSRLIDSSGNIIGQAEFKAGEGQAQIVVRNLSDSSNDKTFTFNKNGTFNSPGAIHLLGNSSTGEGTFQLVNAKTADEMAYAQVWGNGSDRLSVFEVGLASGYLFYAQKVAGGSRILQVNGNIDCVSLSQASDRDLKDNIQIISNATESIRKMNGYTYTLKENGIPYAGVIAQECMEAIPEAVGSFIQYGEELAGPTQSGHELREETRYLNVDYAAVTGLLVQVARETDNRVTELEEENASLRANLSVMDERITKLEALVRQLTGSEE